MKKISVLLSIALLAVMSIACTETKIEADELSGDLILEAIVETGGNSEITTKSANINRNDVPVYVKGLNYTITNGNGSGSDKSDDITYVESGGADNVLIENVSYSANAITATSIPADNTNQPIIFFTLANQDLVDDTRSDDVRTALLTYIAGLYGISNQVMIPYAEYEGTNTVSMVAGNSNSVNVTLDTKNGRDFGTIINTSVYDVTVKMAATNQGANVTADYEYTLNAGSTEAIGYYWSNEYAIEGTYGIDFTVTWKDAYGKIVRTATGTRIISRANESYWAHISATGTGIEDETLSSTFNFTPIDEIGGNYEF